MSSPPSPGSPIATPSTPRDTSFDSPIASSRGRSPRSPAVTPMQDAFPPTPGSTIPQTPISARFASPVVPRGDMSRAPMYLSTPNSMRSGMGGYDTPMGLQSPGSPAPIRALPDNEEGANAVIWGTTVCVRTCIDVFSLFLHDFTLEDQFEPFYEKELHRMHRTQEWVLNLNVRHLFSYRPSAKLAKQLVEYPHEVIPIMDNVVNSEYIRMFGETDLGANKIQVRTYNLGKVQRMRALDPTNIDQLISIKGMIVRGTAIIPDLKQGFFRCFVCGATKEVLIDRGRIDEPHACEACRAQWSMELIHNRCLFTDKQMIRLQETPDEIPEGETPHTVTLFAFDDIVDAVKPGDRVEVTGIFRAVPKRVNPRQRVVRSVYKTYVDVIHFRRADEDDADSAGLSHSFVNLHGLPNDVRKFPPERIAEFEEFARSGDVYEKLVSSLAPSIWELDDVKKGILCQLFGGSMYSSRTGQRADGDENGNGAEDDRFEEDGGDDDSRTQRGGSKPRNDINILLCGDPGTSKSQMLSFVHKIAPRGIYTSGKGSSAVGLTASVIRDPETRDMVLESGALVLSDHGICCIDEFDKMSDTTRAILHEAMEQQTVSIAKAGIIATLNARTSILASANPVQSRYNPRLSVVENIKLPPTLLSRFDLIYLVLDNPNPDNDRRLARHLVSLYHQDQTPQQRRQLVDRTFMRDYISYARNNIQPEIGDAAVDRLVQGYLDMRRMGGSGKTITATPRQLESLIRISQALAKMRLSHVVEERDVIEAIRLMKVATQTAATDPRTGTIDMDMITTGRSAIDRDVILQLSEELRALASHRAGQRLSIPQIRKTLADGSSMEATPAEIIEAVRELEAEGLLQYIERTQTVVIRGH